MKRFINYLLVNMTMYRFVSWLDQIDGNGRRTYKRWYRWQPILQPIVNLIDIDLAYELDEYKGHEAEYIKSLGQL